mmetsp:Transcript_2528/g.3720  ORF Transcript_2528/g.3720 Transcript_2528/m.3720 type:complete len:175 (-) Transcript_2528:712-1236(-)
MIEEGTVELVDVSYEAMARRMSADFDELMKSIRSEVMVDVANGGKDNNCSFDVEMEDEIKDDILRLDMITPNLSDEMDGLNVESMVSAIGQSRVEPTHQAVKLETFPLEKTPNNSAVQTKHAKYDVLFIAAISGFSLSLLYCMGYDNVFSCSNELLLGIGTSCCMSTIIRRSQL